MDKSSAQLVHSAQVYGMISAAYSRPVSLPAACVWVSAWICTVNRGVYFTWASGVNSSSGRFVCLSWLYSSLAPVGRVEKIIILHFRWLDRITTNCCDRRQGSVSGSFQYRSDAFSCRWVASLIFHTSFWKVYNRQKIEFQRTRSSRSREVWSCVHLGNQFRDHLQWLFL